MLRTLWPLALFASGLYAQATVPRPPSKTAKHPQNVTLKCDAKDHCVAYATTRSGTRITVYDDYAKSAGWHRRGDDLAELRMSCGSPCSASIFVDLIKGRKSRPFQDVISVDPSRELVAVSAGAFIEVRKLFGEQTAALKIEREFSPVAALSAAIESAQFNSAGDLVLRYLKGPDFQSIKEVVHLDLKLLNAAPKAP